MGSTDERRGADATTYYRRRPRPSTFLLTVRAAALAGVAALILAAGLAWQMARGADPALGGGTQAAEQPKRVVKTLVVRRVPTSPGSSPAAGAGGYSIGAAPSAPAPAPAPVTTSSS